MAAKTDRLETRLEPEQRALLEQAAAARGLSVSGFVLSAALAEANETLRSLQVTVIPSEFAESFLDLLDAPPGAFAGDFKDLAAAEPLVEVAHSAPLDR